MKVGILLAHVALMLVMVGCAQMTGPYYLNQEKYEQGIQAMNENLQENPEDASSNYYIGRYYLGLEKPKQAMPYLQRAASLAPDDADYQFWVGVGHWALMEFEQERAAYGKALALNPGHISANLYLGHGFLDDGKWKEAIVQYDKVIKLDKYNPEALYNRAEALGKLGKTKEEITAWLKFLEYYPDGSLAMEATQRLNLHGNFTYRNFILGKRNVTLRSMAFKPGTDKLDTASKESLHVIAAMMGANKKLDIHVVAYREGDAASALKRAKAVRDYLLSWDSSLDPSRLALSWFGAAEVVERGGKKFSLHESVQFITAQ